MIATDDGYPPDEDDAEAEARAVRQRVTAAQAFINEVIAKAKRREATRSDFIRAG